MLKEECEHPIGLTAEYAICVDDSSSSSDDDEIDHAICDDDDNPSNNDEIDQKINVGANKASSISSYFKSSSGSEEPEQAVTATKNTPILTGLVSEAKSLAVPKTLRASDNNYNQNNIDSSNPFAAFAFKAEEKLPSSIIKKRTLPSIAARPSKKKTTQLTNNQAEAKTWSIAELQSQSRKNNIKNGYFETVERRQELITKWQSFADENAPLEERRFQVLIAARIHARCQDKVVHQAMQRLREHFAQKKKSLSPQSLARSDAETDIAPLLSSVLFGNVKAQHIVQAAQEVLSKFRGQVPEAMTSLQDITGIGPKLAAILNLVNRRDSYTSPSSPS